MADESSVQSLLDRIKKEGIEKANQSAEDILEKARSKADRIMKEAEARAERTLSEAKAKAERKEKAFEENMAHAGRNLIISVRNQILKLCERIMAQQASQALTPDVMKEIILQMSAKWDPSADTRDMEILLSEKDLQDLEEALHAALQKKLKGEVFLKPVPGIQAGFRIGEKDGHMHYDFSDRTIAEVLSEYLSPRIAKYLKNKDEP